MASDTPSVPAAHGGDLPPGARPWHAHTAADTAARLGVLPDIGLDDTEARTRLARCGPNRLESAAPESLWESLFEALREPMVLLLVAVGVLYALWGEPTDALTIFAVILTTLALEVFNERRAKGAIAALSKLAEPTVSLRRGGRYVEAPADSVVPGDILLLDAGRRVPADARLIAAYGLAADESSLTGESVPVDKEAGAVLAVDTPPAERRNLIFAGTTITRGRATAVAVSTGMATELGRIAGLTRGVKPPRTPLQRTMRELTRWMVWLALGFSVLVPVLGYLRSGQSFQQMLLTGLSLAFATIPEELPLLITAVLALGAYRLSRRAAIVRRLRAAETLSAVTVIATDKTGTLTENRMQVSRVQSDAPSARQVAVQVLCNDAVVSNGTLTGDPMDVALLFAARERGADLRALRRQYPIRQEFTFDTARKLMSVVYERDGSLCSAVKGAPEAILARCVTSASGREVRALTEAGRQALLDGAARMAAQGLRVLALADKRLEESAPTQAAAESDLTFVGLVALADPPRPEAAAAIAACRSAGIRTIMVTGDHPLTARAIAAQVGVDSADRVLTGPELDSLSEEALRDAVGRISVYARATPEHKLRITAALQARGERVAVTGDGVNDAPALVAADIGIAMGETGTDAARAAADIVLADDNFATIVHAVAEGRLLFANLSKAIRYYLAAKVALVGTTLLPVLLGAPVPFAPVQIILMELFMDLGASAAFVAERPESDLMHRRPRDPAIPFMSRAMVRSIMVAAASLLAAVSAAYLATWYRSEDLVRAHTVAFATWLVGHVLLALNLRAEREPLRRLGLFSNRVFPAWAAAAVAVVLLATGVPALQAVLKTAPLRLGDWTVVLVTAVIGTFWIDARKWLTPPASSHRGT